MSALKVGFNAFLLHQYWKRHQTYSLFSWLLLLKMPDGKFLNWLLFNRLSNCMIYDDSTKENQNARQKVVTSFLMFWHKGLKYTRFYYKIFHRWSCQNGTKKSLLNNASFMFIVCYIYAISFKHLFHLYLRLWKQKISTKLFLIQYTLLSLRAVLSTSRQKKVFFYCLPMKRVYKAFFKNSIVVLQFSIFALP